MNHSLEKSDEWASSVVSLLVDQVCSTGDRSPVVFFLDASDKQIVISFEDDYDPGHINHKLRSISKLFGAKMAISAVVKPNERLSDRPLLHIFVENYLLVYMFVYDIYGEKAGALLYRDEMIDGANGGNYVQILKEPSSAN